MLCDQATLALTHCCRLVNCRTDKSMLAKAEENFTKSKQLRTRMLGPRHWWVANVLSNMGDMYKGLGKKYNDKAIECYKDAADIFNDNNKAQKMLKCLKELAPLHRSMDREDAALQAEQDVAVQQKLLG